MSEEQEPPMKAADDAVKDGVDDVSAVPLAPTEAEDAASEFAPNSPVALFEQLALDSHPLPTGRSVSLAHGDSLELDIDALEDPMIGQIIGNFRIAEVIGTGGFGKVYRAEHTMLGESFAVKLLKVDTQSNKEFVKRFQREARVLAQLKHEHVVSLADFGMLPSGGLYIIMEYLRGASLQQRLRAREPFPIPRMRLMVSQMCDVLGYIHRKHVIHRDLKPGNIFLVPDDEGNEKLKLIDFGIAALSEENNEALTQTEAFLGTAKYASPEQIMGEEELDHRSDLYALGILLYRLLAGRLPFRGKGVMSIINQQLNNAPPTLSSLYPNRRWAPRLEAFIQTALAKSREDRPQTAQAFWALCDTALLAQQEVDRVEGQAHTGVFMRTIGGKAPRVTAEQSSSQSSPSRGMTPPSLSHSMLSSTEQRRIREAQRLNEVTGAGLPSAPNRRALGEGFDLSSFGSTPLLDAAPPTPSSSAPIQATDLSSSPTTGSSGQFTPLLEEPSPHSSRFTSASPSQTMTSEHPTGIGKRFWVRLFILVLVGGVCGYGVLFGVTRYLKGQRAQTPTPPQHLRPIKRNAQVPTRRVALPVKVVPDAGVTIARPMPARPMPARPRARVLARRVAPRPRRVRRYVRRRVRRRVVRRKAPPRRVVAPVGPCGATPAGSRWVFGKLKGLPRARPRLRFLGCSKCRSVRRAGGLCLRLPAATGRVRLSVVVEGYQPCVHTLPTTARKVTWNLSEDDPGGLAVTNSRCAVSK